LIKQRTGGRDIVVAFVTRSTRLLSKPHGAFTWTWISPFAWRNKRFGKALTSPGTWGGAIANCMEEDEPTDCYLSATAKEFLFFGEFVLGNISQSPRPVI
jgi:hypothetical protein